MDDNKLAELAEHYAKHMITDFSVSSRTDTALDVDEELPPFNVVDVLEAHATLTESSAEFDGRIIEVNNYVDVIRDDGAEAMIPMDRVAAEDIDTAQVSLAAQFHALYAEAHSIMRTFAGLDRIRQALADEAAK
ncbi:hypothetical protein AB0L53_54620 [Nonomuraea sp. NPDC052129]|uniref:hypothetical protein n=1 Tax=Nonomuraea sp. NPDC052129 TaxID=3154651 RepID=UPI0034227A02